MNKAIIKPQYKLGILTTSLLLLATPTASATTNISTSEIELNYENIQYVSNPPTQEINKRGIKTVMNDYKEKQKEERLKQIKEELERRELERIKQEQIKKQKKLEELRKQREEFHFIVKNKDITNIDLRISSGLTAEQADNILAGTGLSGLGKSFIEAERKYGVNAYYLMAHAAWESQWGESSLAINKNNLFGFTAYDASPGKSATFFSSKEESINKVAAYIRKNYLEGNGKYHNGSNLQGMNVKYATDESWAYGIGSIMKNLVAKTTL